MKTLGTLAAVLLTVLTVLLTGGVAQRMAETQSPQFSAMPYNGDTDPGLLPANGSASFFDEQVVVIGDFTAGSDEGGRGDNNWTAQIGALINDARQARIITDTSSGAGSGYVARGTGLTFPDQVSRLVGPATDVVVICGSRNDIVAAPVDVKAAATEAYRQIAAIAPAASVVVVGPTWVDDAPPRQLLSIRDAVASAAGEAGARFIDPIADHWFSVGAGLVGADNVHPTDAGHTRIADLMTPVVIAAMDSRAGR
jgi:lysophospholipase L1-like esterase